MCEYSAILESLESIDEEFEELTKENDPINESVKLLAFANFNLGVHYQDIITEPDTAQAANYLRKAITIFESREIPTPECDHYHSCALERLKVIEG